MKKIDWLWLLLGIISLWLKQSFDLSMWENEGVQVNIAHVLTNNTLVDSILWIAFSLFGALFVLSKISDMRELYPLLPGRITSRTRLIRKEIVMVCSRTAGYVLLSFLVSLWNGNFTVGTTFSLLYAWMSLSFLVTLLLILENRFGIWLILLIISTVSPLSSYLPWMYGQAYNFWQSGTALIHTCFLLALSFALILMYIIKMKSADLRP
ncbi:hypothetical protein PJ311_01840 [Bacillus sp. CLL-7-23]|uniref:ABC-2 type transport system permease protein n=1 Tax=Bacillus changyiensis TaxID=3004103 RepID=A0ABT4X0Y3_9BACI|nr:hypothetical protein [Bacillus changyiensis]MDA7025349.1 hypothetical protein [Bacillus changyiensis]